LLINELSALGGTRFQLLMHSNSLLNYAYIYTIPGTHKNHQEEPFVIAFNHNFFFRMLSALLNQMHARWFTGMHICISG
jgi:hypothetical protein